jgi:hypothetical protein
MSLFWLAPAASAWVSTAYVEAREHVIHARYRF